MYAEKRVVRNDNNDVFYPRSFKLTRNIILLYVVVELPNPFFRSCSRQRR